MSTSQSAIISLWVKLLAKAESLDYDSGNDDDEDVEDDDDDGA